MTTEQENTKTKLDRNTGRTEKQDFFGRHQILFMKLIKEILQYSHCYIGNLINQRRGCEHHFSPPQYLDWTDGRTATLPGLHTQLYDVKWVFGRQNDLQ